MSPSKTGTAANNMGYWSWATNAYSDGGGSASLSQTARSKWHQYSNWSWTGGDIPLTATIVGIEVKNDLFVEPGCDAWGSLDVKVRGSALASFSSAQNTSFPQYETTKTVGSPTFLWGKSWTPAMFDDPAEFEIYIEAKGCILGTEQVYREKIDDTINGYGGCWHICMLEVGQRIAGYKDGAVSWTEVLNIEESESEDGLFIHIDEPEKRMGLACTDIHPIYVEGDWVLARDIEAGMKLFGRDKESYEVVEVEKIAGRHKVYDLTTDCGNFFVNGLLVKNKENKACSVGVKFSWHNDWIRPVVYYTEGETQSWWTP